MNSLRQSGVGAAGGAEGAELMTWARLRSANAPILHPDWGIEVASRAPKPRAVCSEKALLEPDGHRRERGRASICTLGRHEWAGFPPGSKNANWPHASEKSEGARWCSRDARRAFVTRRAVDTTSPLCSAVEDIGVCLTSDAAAMASSSKSASSCSSLSAPTSSAVAMTVDAEAHAFIDMWPTLASERRDEWPLLKTHLAASKRVPRTGSVSA
eukprot:scaffold84269_cov33-Tisochrysis_lutea.AAC.1